MKVYPISVNNNQLYHNKKSGPCCPKNMSNVNFNGKENAIKLGAGVLGGSLLLTGLAVIAAPAAIGGLLATGLVETIIGGTATATTIGALTEDRK